MPDAVGKHLFVKTQKIHPNWWAEASLRMQHNVQTKKNQYVISFKQNNPKIFLLQLCAASSITD